MKEGREEGEQRRWGCHMEADACGTVTEPFPISPWSSFHVWRGVERRVKRPWVWCDDYTDRGGRKENTQELFLKSIEWWSKKFLRGDVRKNCCSVMFEYQRKCKRQQRKRSDVCKSSCFWLLLKDQSTQMTKNKHFLLWYLASQISSVSKSTPIKSVFSHSPGLQAWRVVPVWFPVCAAGCRPPSHSWTTVYLQVKFYKKCNQEIRESSGNLCCAL